MSNSDVVQAIPFVLHQIGRDDSIPDHLAAFCRSWKEWNPDLNVIYWSAQTLRQFVVDQAPSYLSLFDGYSHDICRANLGRYLLLQYYGGIYADLGCQCLCRLEPLLQGRELLIAPEPASHHQQSNVLDRGLEKVFSPAFMASIAAHPFWSDVLDVLCEFEPSSVQTYDDVLDATGSFLLGRVIMAKPMYERHLVPQAWIYPFSQVECWHGLVFDPIFWMRRTSESFVAHYWDGSWFQSSRGLHAFVPSKAPVNISSPSLPTVKGTKHNQGLIIRDSNNPLPLISCLMITRGRVCQARLAIQSFLNQTYLRRELIVVDDDSDASLSDWISGLSCDMIRLFRLPNEGMSLGELRNFSVLQSLGEYVCQWDDDDLYDPVRLEMQMGALLSTGSDVAVLSRFLIWWPHRKRLAVSCFRDWEGSFLCRRDCLPLYPAQRQGEDSAVFEQLRKRNHLARIDMPRLYLYVVHGLNTFHPSHFDRHWEVATARWQGADLERLRPELQRRLLMREYLECV